MTASRHISDRDIMATCALRLALFALFFSVKTETNGQIMTVLVELHSTVELPCSCPICPESTVAVQWYRSSTSDVFKRGGNALASWHGGTKAGSHVFGNADDFSMYIYSVKLTHTGLFRCIVTPAGGVAECTRDVKLEIYANPDSPPVLKYILRTNGVNVTCSISNVFPMAFPTLTTKEGKTTASNNSDGTYNTTVNHLFPANEKDTTIECIYSNRNFRSISFLRIVDNETIGNPREEDMMENNMTNTDYKYTPLGIWMVWMILATEVFFVFVIVHAIITGRVIVHPTQRKTEGNNKTNIDREENCEDSDIEEESPESTKTILSCTLITLILPITVIVILLVAYLATAGRFTVVGKKLEEDIIFKAYVH